MTCCNFIKLPFSITPCDYRLLKKRENELVKTTTMRAMFLKLILLISSVYNIINIILPNYTSNYVE